MRARGHVRDIPVLSKTPVMLWARFVIFENHYVHTSNNHSDPSVFADGTRVGPRWAAPVTYFHIMDGSPTQPMRF